MPNWCSNRVNVYPRDYDNQTHKEDLVKALEIFESQDTVFGKVIPEPNWSTIPNDDGDLPRKREIKNPNGEVFTTVDEFSDGSQDDRWYTWRNKNWDTKWDVSGNVEIEEERWENELESFTATFNTAWSPPERVCYKLRDMFPNVRFSWFFDEPGTESAGYL